MSIGIGFGPEFATRIEHIEIGVHQVTKDLVLPPGAADDLLAAFIPAHQSGNPREEVKAVRGVLEGREWTWSWMLSAADEMMQIGIWPSWWDRNGFRPGSPWGDMPQATRLDLLVQALWGACYIARDEAQMRDCMRRFGWPIKLMIGRKECPAEAYFVGKYASAIERGHYRIRPPFFPLDQTRLRSDPDGAKVHPDTRF